MMQRSFYVGEHITEEDVKASYESGVLQFIPKKTRRRCPKRKSSRSKAKNKYHKPSGAASKQ